MLDDNDPVFVISVAAQLSGLHPQTLRTYDKLGLVQLRDDAKAILALTFPGSEYKAEEKSWWKFW